MNYIKERLEPDAYDDHRLISVFRMGGWELNIITYGPMNDQIPI